MKDVVVEIKLDGEPSDVYRITHEGMEKAINALMVGKTTEVILKDTKR